MSKPETEFVPLDEWPSLTEMAVGLAGNRLPNTQELAGRSLSLTSGEGATLKLAFETDAVTADISTDDAESSRSGSGSYEEVRVRPGIYLVDLALGEGAETLDAALAIDLEHDRALAAISRFVAGSQGLRVHTTFHQCRIGAAAPAALPPSTALIGKRIRWHYSDNNVYEHMYLNSGTFAWHCLHGPEAHMADVEQTRAWEVAEDLVLFFWTETVMPIDSLIFIDLREMQSTGRFFGWDAASEAVTRLTFGAGGTLLNETRHPTFG